MALTAWPIAYDGREWTLMTPAADDLISRSVQDTGGFYELEALDTIRLLVDQRPLGTVVDAGAFCGNHTLFFATQLNAAGVIACEPTRLSFEALTQTIAANGLANVTPLNVA